MGWVQNRIWKSSPPVPLKCVRAVIYYFLTVSWILSVNDSCLVVSINLGHYIIIISEHYILLISEHCIIIISEHCIIIISEHYIIIISEHYIIIISEWLLDYIDYQVLAIKQY